VRPGVERAAAGARASGTPFVSFFTPAEMLRLGEMPAFGRFGTSSQPRLPNATSRTEPTAFVRQIIRRTASGDHLNSGVSLRFAADAAGLVYRGADPTAAYFVYWTAGDVDSHGAHFDLIVGRWGERATLPTVPRSPWSSDARSRVPRSW
jgi:hypothetical protein